MRREQTSATANIPLPWEVLLDQARDRIRLFTLPLCMDEVYKSRDTRLDRTFAIKVLPPHTAERPCLGQRFEREARVVSALHHPHICMLYDIGRRTGRITS